MGSGQPNRVESLRIAMRKAGADVKGAALASDAFFPFGKCKWQYSNSFYMLCCKDSLVVDGLMILFGAYFLRK